MRVSIPKPCHANWNSMSKEEQSRFCSLCKTSVYNVADLTEQEAETVLSKDDICARITHNDEGHIQTRNGFSSVLIITGLLACNDTSVEPTLNATHETVEQIEHNSNTGKTKGSADEHIWMGKTTADNTDQKMQNHEEQQTEKQTADEDCATQNTHTSQGNTSNPKPPKMGRIFKPKNPPPPEVQE